MRTGGGQSFGPTVIVGHDGVTRVDARGATRKTHYALRAKDIAGLTPSTWQQLLVAFEGRCRYCGEDRGESLQRDHRRALASGGRNEAANIVPACAECNLYKGFTNESEYLDLLRGLTSQSGWMPAAATSLLEKLATDPRKKQDRTVTLLKEAFASASYYKPYGKPTSAIMIDPPGVDEVSSDGAESWIPRGTPIAGISFHTANAEHVARVANNGALWGFLLPEAANIHDSDAVAVYARGRKLGFLPRGQFEGARKAARQAWAEGQLPVVRVQVWNSTYLGGRVHVASGHVVRSF